MVNFPIKSGDFPIAMLIYQRVGCKGTPYFHTNPVSRMLQIIKEMTWLLLVAPPWWVDQIFWCILPLDIGYG
jgi:hypothetical protein